LGYLTVINCAEWTNFIKNPFDWFTRQIYLNRISPSSPSSRHPTRKFTPPYGLTFASFTDAVGVVDNKTKTCTIAAGHMNGYLIILGIVYRLSIKLQKGVMHDHLGQDTEVNLIEFLTQFGYATRKSPTVQLHAAHTYYCSDVNEMKYIQGCDGIHCIIPVTLFLVSLYNACFTFTFQHKKNTNLLISALDCFNLGTRVDDDTFMSTMIKSPNTALISKQEFHAIIIFLHLLNSSPSTPLSTAGLSWYIHNAANIISTKIAQKTSAGKIVGKCLSSSNSLNLDFVMN
jgi:hypothetical protein